MKSYRIVPRKMFLFILSMLIIIFSIVLLFTGKDKNQVEVESSPFEETYSFTEKSSGYKYLNKVDGYSINLNEQMDVDMSISSVCSILENKNTRIEIFSQQLSDEVSSESYIYYSNRFLDNRIDHYDVSSSIETINGYSTYFTSWSRDKLARVNNDKNNYSCVDIVVNEDQVFTIFIKSSNLIDKGYAKEIAHSFSIEKITSEPYTRTTKTTSLAEKEWNKETTEFYETYFSKDAPLTWGTFNPSAPTDLTDLHKKEKAIGYKFPIIIKYTHFKEEGLKGNDWLNEAYEDGRFIELAFQTNITTNYEKNGVYKALNGEYDSFIKSWAKKIAKFEKPVLVRIGNEMNGDWCPYSSFNTSRDPMIFKEFYNYIYGIFEDAGANGNTIWIWNPNGESKPDFKWNHELMYYTSDDRVDVVGMTLYNTGTYYDGEEWLTFNELYDTIYDDYLERYNKPFMITEFACADVGGDKTEWVKEMLTSIEKDYPEIKIAIWWDGTDKDANGNIARSYIIDETPELLKVFNEYFKSK